MRSGVSEVGSTSHDDRFPGTAVLSNETRIAAGGALAAARHTSPGGGGGGRCCGFWATTGVFPQALNLTFRSPVRIVRIEALATSISRLTVHQRCQIAGLRHAGGPDVGRGNKRGGQSWAPRGGGGGGGGGGLDGAAAAMVQQEQGWFGRQEFQLLNLSSLDDGFGSPAGGGGGGEVLQRIHMDLDPRRLTTAISLRVEEGFDDFVTIRQVRIHGFLETPSRAKAVAAVAAAANTAAAVQGAVNGIGVLSGRLDFMDGSVLSPTPQKAERPDRDRVEARASSIASSQSPQAAQDVTRRNLFGTPSSMSQNSTSEFKSSAEPEPLDAPPVLTTMPRATSQPSQTNQANQASGASTPSTPRATMAPMASVTLAVASHAHSAASLAVDAAVATIEAPAAQPCGTRQQNMTTPPRRAAAAAAAAAAEESLGIVEPDCGLGGGAEVEDFPYEAAAAAAAAEAAKLSQLVAEAPDMTPNQSLTHSTPTSKPTCGFRFRSPKRF